jgi:hypothetical protein
VIHTSEFGVGKFHRYDNKAHAYDANNAWGVYILPDNADTGHPLARKNGDGSFTVFYSTLDELIGNVIAISQREGKKVSVLNVHGHGLPGAMWFPKDEADLRGIGCWQWSQAASGADEDNYNQYYSAVSSDDIWQIRQMANNTSLHMGCTVGLPEWQAGAQRAPAFRQVFADDAQIHFLSCVVGLGTRGEAFTKGIGALLLGRNGRVYTSMNFGLGDWSMPKGMGFWDMQSEEQVRRDGANYTAHKRDSEIAQKGTVRVGANDGSAWIASLVADRDFMPLDATVLSTVEMPAEFFAPTFQSLTVPASVRVPGTNAYVSVEQ